MSFNYIITIHNKEALLARVLEGVTACAGSDARIILVVDGCTDGSEGIARKFAAQSRVDTRVVLAPDVHEIRSINAGLQEAQSGYCIILQDDVVLREPELERKLLEIDQRHHYRLGYVSMRLAADVKGTNLLRRLRQLKRWGVKAMRPLVYVHNYIGHPDEVLKVQRGNYGTFYSRMVGIKSPVCITPALREVAPRLDEALAPYCYDDVDMSLTALRHGLVNGLFPVRFDSELDWGGTRKDPEFSGQRGQEIVRRNREIVWKKHGNFIRQTLAAHQAAK
jgi:glycosyltransferase involved in cell wall biosynthesis